MRYTSPPRELFLRNREKFTRQMPPGHLAILFSSEMVTRSADYTYPFAQDKNFYYLTGLDQEGLVLVLFPDAPKKEWREILFVPVPPPNTVLVDGQKLRPREVSEISGIKRIRDASTFERMSVSAMGYAEGVLLDANEHEGRRWSQRTQAHRFARWIAEEYPGYRIERAAPIFRRLRMKKEAEELTQLRIACSIAGKAIHRVAQVIRPGVWEYEIEAEITHEFIRNRAAGPAFPSIVASGPNTCVLHYVRNHRQCGAGELLQLDLGAEYGHYNSDVSRAFPISGRFSERQRAVYEAVLRVLKGTMQAMKPGVRPEDLQQLTGEMVNEELLTLGVLSAEQAKNTAGRSAPYRRYFMHGVAHHLGLDTHDLSNRFAEYAPGMVLTVEPGIYLPEEELGIRLENDVLITETGIENLTAGIPIEVEDIEALMD
ncbi:MAG: aminopeptidase P N-terminal domain-containing protein [Bacteroidota bacterium]